MIGDNIEIMNRAPWPLTAMKDGRSYKIPVGKSWLRSDVVPYAKAQNPIMGSEDPNGPEFESLIGVVAPKGTKQIDAIDPLPKEVIDALPKERINRSLLDPDRQAGVEERKTTFPTRRVSVEAPSEGMVDGSGAIRN
jgi:hypothetical protein